MTTLNLGSTATGNSSVPAVASAALRVSEWSDPISWDNFVTSSQDGTICHLFGWKTVIEQAYGQRTFYLASHDGNEIHGLLPLVLTRSPLFGVHLTSMPYMDYGGILTDHDGARSALLERAREICASESADLNLRYRQAHDLNLPTSFKRVSMILELGESVDDLWSRLPSARRNRIRKGQKNGLIASWHRESGLQDFFTVFARNMRDLGSPVHGLGFFRSILQAFNEQSAILLVRDGAVTTGAAFCLFHGDTMSIPWVSSLRPYFKRCPNQILYWEAMRYGIDRGCRFLDFGRSARGDGTFEAKRQWGASPLQLHWVYEPDLIDSEDEASGRYGNVTYLWKKLPVPMTRLVGPWIRKKLPS